MSRDLTKIGLKAAAFLTNNFKQPLIYEKLMKYIFEEMNKTINVNQICIYVIDSEMENLKEEAMYNRSGWIPGYDFISAEDISSELKNKEVIKYSEDNYNILQVPLHTGSQLLGLMELRTISPLAEECVSEIIDMTVAISLGLRSVLFEADTIREEENTQFFININNKLQSIDDQDQLINTFLKMTINYYEFDRITVFIFADDNEVLFARGINEQGKRFDVDDYSQIPDVYDGKMIV
ncbi:MAG: hypothetical protein ACOCZR_04620, partial [Halanaerobiales bacterium]